MKQAEKTKITVERIISAGIEEFGAKGYQAASINSISDSGIAKGLIYHNFSGKDELYIECLKKSFREITKALACSNSSCDYKAYFARRLELFKEKKAMAAMVLEALINPPEKHTEEISRLRVPYDEMNGVWIRNIIGCHKLSNNTDMDSAMKYLSIMQDMFNRYYCSCGLSGKSFESLISSHEENIPKMFEYMLFGILKEE